MLRARNGITGLTFDRPTRHWRPRPAANLDKLFQDTLRDVCYAKRKGLQALKKHARAPRSEIVGKRPQGKTCAAMDGIAEQKKTDRFLAEVAINAAAEQQQAV